MIRIKPIKFKDRDHLLEEMYLFITTSMKRKIERIGGCLFSLWKWEQNEISKSEMPIWKGIYLLGSNTSTCGLCKINDGGVDCHLCSLAQLKFVIPDEEGCCDVYSEAIDKDNPNKQPLIEALTIATAKEITEEVIRRSTKSITKELKELKEVFEGMK